MKSKITIDVDFNNQPIIKIQYIESEDVRDKLVKRFTERFGHVSAWCTWYPATTNGESWISPITYENLLEHQKLIKTTVDYHSPLQNYAEETISGNTNNVIVATTV